MAEMEHSASSDDVSVDSIGGLLLLGGFLEEVQRKLRSIGLQDIPQANEYAGKALVISLLEQENFWGWCLYCLVVLNLSVFFAPRKKNLGVGF
ncbi:uncharacterized protein LOC132310309 isoform X1 [Cornus florida]|uniref:uncharacterized protein LOC132310309 isoform X1 n=1 Tax=Cornus florida TaxID=4283 RepID=UPI00289DBB58|nr:uncharacterized protein LOC132310309 isoform X1 [Cornus florida]